MQLIEFWDQEFGRNWLSWTLKMCIGSSLSNHMIITSSPYHGRAGHKWPGPALWPQVSTQNLLSSCGHSCMGHILLRKMLSNPLLEGLSIHKCPQHKRGGEGAKYSPQDFQGPWGPSSIAQDEGSVKMHCIPSNFYWHLIIWAEIAYWEDWVHPSFTVVLAS